jgi:hypothetical protein
MQPLLAHEAGHLERTNTSRLDVGSAVRAQYVTQGYGSCTAKWFGGTVDQINGDGTFNILYDDGDYRESVPPAQVRPNLGRAASRRPLTQYCRRREEVIAQHLAKARVRERQDKAERKGAQRALKQTRITNCGMSFRELHGEIVGKMALYYARGVPWLSLVCKRLEGIGVPVHVCKEMNCEAENGVWERAQYGSTSRLTQAATRFYERRKDPPADLPHELRDEWARASTLSLEI